MLPEHLFVDCEGALYDTRVPRWAEKPPLRRIYERHYGYIDGTQELRASLRAGPYAWPGGYPLAFVTSDGALLSFEAVEENYASVSNSVRDNIDDGWRVTGVLVCYEDTYCDHTGELIR